MIILRACVTNFYNYGWNTEKLGAQEIDLNNRVPSK